MTKPIPEQYRQEAGGLVYEIGNLADKLMVIVSELGDKIEFECGECKIVISKKESDVKNLSSE